MPEQVLILLVHLMLGEPKGEFGDVVSEVVDLDAVEVLQRDSAVRKQRCFAALEIDQSLQDAVLQRAQPLVRDNQKVARAARRVEDLDLAKMV